MCPRPSPVASSWSDAFTSAAAARTDDERQKSGEYEKEEQTTLQLLVQKYKNKQKYNNKKAQKEMNVRKSERERESRKTVNYLTVDMNLNVLITSLLT
jgi:hypothetical protein